MESGIRIDEYAKTLNTGEKKRQFLISFSEELAHIHANNQYINFYNYNGMFVSNNRIFFAEISDMPLDTKHFYISKNLEGFAALAVGLYLETGLGSPLNPEVVNNYYDTWKGMINPSEDANYYHQVLNNENQESLYLYDFVNALERSKNTNQAGTSNNKQLIKTSGQSTISTPEIHPDENRNQMAFAQTVYLTVTLAIFGLMMIALAFIIVYR